MDKAFLLTKAQDKIVQTIKFLQEHNEVEPNLTIREIYDKYLHPDVLDTTDEAVWKNIREVKVLDLFQFDSDVGAQAAKKISPKSITELADANGLMRLMTAEEGAEMPMEKYIRYKNNINLWYQEMDAYGLTKEEQEVIKPYYINSYGVPPTQEFLMRILMDKKVCNFSLKEANNARKIVSKKKMEQIPAFRQKIMDTVSSTNLGKYIWDCGVTYQLGYGFSEIHALAYSFIGYQTAYLATHWNPIYWNTACLIINSASLMDDEDTLEEDEDEKKNGHTNDYAKIAKAIGDIRSRGIKITLVDINKSGWTFEPDVENNQILYGLRPISGLNEEVLTDLMSKRNFVSLKDFMERCKIKKPAMINLIKAGAFDNIEPDLTREEIMGYYIMSIAGLKKTLNLTNFQALLTDNLIPETDLASEKLLFAMNKAIKKRSVIIGDNEYYYLNAVCISFLSEYYPSELENVILDGTCNGMISKKIWEKRYDKLISPARDYLKKNQDKLLQIYNAKLFQDTWDKYATGNISSWEMDSVCFYWHEHELAHIDYNKYGLADFANLPSTPTPISYFRRIPIFDLTHIIGTVVAKNDVKSTVSLLTTSGVVTVKFSRDYYAQYKRRITKVNDEGKKKVLEEGWFTRGTKLMVTGFRRDDMFIAKAYKSTNTHRLYKIIDVQGSEMILQHERADNE